MLKTTRPSVLVILLVFVVALAPVMFGQEPAAQDNSFRNQLIFGGAAIIIMLLYVMRRKKRKSKE